MQYFKTKQCSSETERNKKRNAREMDTDMMEGVDMDGEYGSGRFQKTENVYRSLKSREG